MSEKWSSRMWTRVSLSLLWICTPVRSLRPPSQHRLSFLASVRFWSVWFFPIGNKSHKTTKTNNVFCVSDFAAVSADVRGSLKKLVTVVSSKSSLKQRGNCAFVWDYFKWWINPQFLLSWVFPAAGRCICDRLKTRNMSCKSEIWTFHGICWQ